jgi:hypothetical protein
VLYPKDTGFWILDKDKSDTGYRIGNCLPPNFDKGFYRHPVSSIQYPASSVRLILFSLDP